VTTAECRVVYSYTRCQSRVYTTQPAALTRMRCHDRVATAAAANTPAGAGASLLVHVTTGAVAGARKGQLPLTHRISAVAKPFWCRNFLV